MGGSPCTDSRPVAFVGLLFLIALPSATILPSSVLGESHTSPNAAIAANP
jgi:hypothetical protein